VSVSLCVCLSVVWEVEVAQGGRFSGV